MNRILTDSDKFEAAPQLTGGEFKSELAFHSPSQKLGRSKVRQAKSLKQAAAEIFTIGSWPTQGRSLSEK
jgi:hypothetical protein